MTKQIVTFNVRMTYEVDCKSPITAQKKAVEALQQNIPFVGDEDEGVTCTSVLVEQCLHILKEEPL
jgi:hypothetical protein